MESLLAAGRTAKKLLLAAGSSVLIAITAWAELPQPMPTDSNNYVVYLADGLYDPLTPNPNPQITNCDPATNLCDGDYFQKEILGRTEEEIVAAEQQAKDYFNSRFGIDVDDPANAGRLVFRMFQIDPRVNYHVIFASGKRVPGEGWPVYYGGWIIMVVDPKGIDLGGDFAGAHTGFGGMFIFGENVLDTTSGQKDGNRYSKPPKEHDRIVIHYQSPEPPFVPRPGPLGVGESAIMFKLELSSNAFGSGLARGRGEIIPRENGLIKMDIVSVLSFPGLGESPPVMK
ncbi:hypothetical protein [Methylocaldum gracile]|jgi:hypothetical protein|uniref:hypothetical protein n=1 Tax=Methylocaldum sp. 0917 TaxID=2485163 RepID=UPI00105C37E8